MLYEVITATTRAGMLTNPLLDRFGIVARLEFYSEPEHLTHPGMQGVVREEAGEGPRVRMVHVLDPVRNNFV